MVRHHISIHNPSKPRRDTLYVAKGETADAPAKKKAPKVPKVPTESTPFDRDAHEAKQEKKLRDVASAYPDTGRGATGEKSRARQAETAAKTIKAFEKHKAAQLAKRAAGVHKQQSQINFRQFLNKLRVRKGDRTNAAKAAKVLKKSAAKKL